MSQLRKYDESLAMRVDDFRNEINTPLRGIDDPVIRAQAVERQKEATRNFDRS